MNSVRMVFALLLLFIVVDLVASSIIYVNPRSSTTSTTTCGSSSRPCKLLKSAINKFKNGDIIRLSTGTHLVQSAISLNKLIEVVIEGKGQLETIIKLSDTVGIKFYQSNLTISDLTIQGGLGLDIHAVDKTGADTTINLHVNMERVNFLNNRNGALKLFAPSYDESDSFGTISAFFYDVIFKGSKGRVTVECLHECTADFYDCTWEDNEEGILNFYGENDNNQCPYVTITRGNFINNRAEGALFMGGTDDCDDKLIFYYNATFLGNEAPAILGYTEGEGWGYGCEGCRLFTDGNDLDGMCAALCYSSAVPACRPDDLTFPGIWPWEEANNFCADGFGMEVTLKPE